MEHHAKAKQAQAQVDENHLQIVHGVVKIQVDARYRDEHLGSIDGRRGQRGRKGGGPRDHLSGRPGSIGVRAGRRHRRVGGVFSRGGES